METASANQLRALICGLRAQGLGASEIARRLGCSRTTVYSVLRAPGPDRRSRRGRRPLPAAEVGRAMVLLGSGASQGAGGEPSPGGAAAVGPYAKVAPEAFGRVAGAGSGLADEVGYTRVLLCEVLEKLQVEVELREKLQLWACAARLLSVLPRLQRGSGSAAADVQRMIGWIEEVGREVQEAAWAAGAAAGAGEAANEVAAGGRCGDGGA